MDDDIFVPRLLRIPGALWSLHGRRDLCSLSLCAWLLSVACGADLAFDVPLECVGGAKGTVALAAAVVSALLARVASSAMVTDTAPSTLLAAVAVSAMLTDLAPSTLLAPAAESAVLTDTGPSTLLALSASSAMLTDMSPSTLLAMVGLASMLAVI